MAETRDVVFWTAQPTRLRNMIADAIRTDPNPYVRIELLRALGFAPIPISWAPTLLDSFRRTEAVLAETPFTQAERQTLAKYLAEVAAKLQTASAPTFSPTTIANFAEPVTTQIVPLPEVNPDPFDWKPWAALGAALAVAGGAAAVVRYHGSSTRSALR